MTNQPVLSTRHTAAVSQREQNSGGMLDRFGQLVKAAEYIAQGEPGMLPKELRNSPGSCAVILDIAERYDISIGEAIQGVSFSNGKMTFSARLQKKFASRAGFHAQKVEGDDNSCTVAVFNPSGEEIGRATYTWEMAENLGIPFDYKGNLKAPWRDRGQMLFHRAMTRALDHYGPSDLPIFTTGDVLVGVDAPPVDLVDLTGSVSSDGGEVLEAARAAGPVDVPVLVAEVSDAELFEHDPTSDAVVVPDLVSAAKAAGVTKAAIIKAAGVEFPDAGLSTFGAIQDNLLVGDWVAKQLASGSIS